MNKEKRIEQSLTPKQLAFFKAYFDPDSETFGNGVRSALEVYDTDSYETAGNIASENLKKPKINELMEAKGIGVGRLLKILDEGLESTKVVSAVIVGADANDKTDDFIEVPDYSTRHRYLKTAGEWANLTKDKIEMEHKIEATVLAGELPEEVKDAIKQGFRQALREQRPRDSQSNSN